MATAWEEAIIPRGMRFQDISCECSMNPRDGSLRVELVLSRLSSFHVLILETMKTGWNSLSELCVTLLGGQVENPGAQHPTTNGTAANAFTKVP